MSIFDQGDSDTGCVGICSTLFDPICKGCGRTAYEVDNWVFLSDEDKEAARKRSKEFKMKDEPVASASPTIEDVAISSAHEVASQWRKGTPTVGKGKHDQFIVAIRRAHNQRKVYVGAAYYVNDDDMTGWYSIAEGGFLGGDELSPRDEVLGWQEFPKWED